MELRNLVEAYFIVTGGIGFPVMCYIAWSFNKTSIKYFNNWSRVTEKYDDLILKVLKEEV
ncbi:TMhelix containing protein [Vibrio phage 1.193.O._10N.286.52.C6]|nr:TMhelix containing protein [Vibrio phage 1.193.O._10N.286.52.C6]